MEQWVGARRRLQLGRTFFVFLRECRSNERLLERIGGEQLCGWGRMSLVGDGGRVMAGRGLKVQRKVLVVGVEDACGSARGTADRRLGLIRLRGRQLGSATFLIGDKTF